MMENRMRSVAAGILVCFGTAGAWAAGAPSAAGAPQGQTAPAAGAQTAPQSGVNPEAPDHARAYYHYMLARRFKELAALYNRGDYIDKAVSEYKQAMEADPDSLFLRTELAELYWRIGRATEAIQEAEGVLKANPNDADAHRLLGRIYVRNLSEAQPGKSAKEILEKAVVEFEAVSRIEPTDTESWVTLGRLYRMSNQSGKAEEAFKKGLTSEPDSREALSGLAQLYSDQGEYDQAIDLLTKIPDVDSDPFLLGMLGYAYSQSRDYDKAIATFEKALARDPENLEIHRAYAEALMGAGKNDAARDELKKTLGADADDGQTYLRMAQLDRQEGRFDDARKELERARALIPDNMEVLFQQVLLESDTGNDDRAIQIVQNLLKETERQDGQYSLGEATNRAIFLERQGLIYRNEEKYDQALEVFRQILPLGKTQAPRAEGLIIETLRLDRKPQEAVAEADKAVELYPHDRSLKIIRASMMGEQGKVDEGVRELQGMISGTPSDLDVNLSIAQIYSQAKRFPEAEAAANRALQIATRPEDQNRAQFIFGSIYEREKKYDQAELTFKKVLTADPLNAAAANYLGYMLADRGVRLDESVKYIQKALQLEPNNGAYLDSLGWAYLKMNRLDLAELNLEKAAHRITSDPTIHEHLGRLYLQMGKQEQAQAQWERALKEWPGAVSSDFDGQEAAKLQKELDELRQRMANQKPARQ